MNEKQFHAIVAAMAEAGFPMRNPHLSADGGMWWTEDDSEEFVAALWKANKITGEPMPYAPTGWCHEHYVAERVKDDLSALEATHCGCAAIG